MSQQAGESSSLRERLEAMVRLYRKGKVAQLDLFAGGAHRSEKETEVDDKNHTALAIRQGCFGWVDIHFSVVRAAGRGAE